MNIRLITLLLLITTFSFAQKATITGTILDKEYDNEPLPFANVTIKGTTSGTTTDDLGKYRLMVEPGSYVLQISFLGYTTKEIPFKVIAAEKKVIDWTLEADGVQLETLELTAAVSKESEQAILKDQQKAVEIKQAIGAQELSKKGVSDVAAAVIKTSGVAKQEGSGNIFVRGMGDRYNSTSMNGLPIPSNDPEKKNIDLGIFPTDIVEFVSIDKVFNSKIYGDFAGGNIDIASKDYNGDGFLAVGIKSAVNTNAIAKDQFQLNDGPNFIGFKNYNSPSNPLSGYNFQNSLNPNIAAPIASGISITGGEKFKLGEVSSISLFSTLSFDNEYSSITDGVARNANGTGLSFKDFNSYESDKYTTNTTALLNLGYKINNNKIKFNSVFINTSSQNVKEYKGTDLNSVGDDAEAYIRRAEYIKNSLFINQLLGEHKYKERTVLNWGLSHNQVKGNMPDRTTNTLRTFDNGATYFVNKNSASDNQRYFQELTENETALNLAVDFKFKKTESDEYKGKLTVGYNGKYKVRDFEAIQYNFKINGNAGNPASTTVVDPNNLDGFFNQDNFNNNYFTIITYNGGVNDANALVPQTYNGLQIISSAFGNVEYKFSDKLFLIAGLRSDQVYQKVKWKTQVDPAGDKNYFTKVGILPNITGKYELNDKQNLRFGASKTYTLPQFKETALFIYEDITEQKIGNPDIYPSDNYNFDLKWELFPAKEEVIAATAFGKYIQNPMNEVTIASSSNDISFINTGDWGYAAGIELEVKKNFFSIESDGISEKISGGLNVSYMKTKQELDNEKVKNETRFNTVFTDSYASFSGASNLLLNADVSYSRELKASDKSFNSTVSFAIASDKIYAIGTQTRGNIVEKSVPSLDWILKSKLSKDLGLNLSLKNLINPKYKWMQENKTGDVLVQSFRKGRNISLSINYEF